MTIGRHQRLIWGLLVAAMLAGGPEASAKIMVGFAGPLTGQMEYAGEQAQNGAELAIAELNALPDDAHERAVAEQILLRFHHALEKKPRRTPEEQELIVTMYTSLAQVREEGRRQGEEQGRKHGEEQGRKRGEEQGRKRGLREGQKKGREQGQKQPVQDAETGSTRERTPRSRGARPNRPELSGGS